MLKTFYWKPGMEQDTLKTPGLEERIMDLEDIRCNCVDCERGDELRGPFKGGELTACVFRQLLKRSVSQLKDLTGCLCP